MFLSVVGSRMGCHSLMDFVQYEDGWSVVGLGFAVCGGGEVVVGVVRWVGLLGLGVLHDLGGIDRHQRKY